MFNELSVTNACDVESECLFFECGFRPRTLFSVLELSPTWGSAGRATVWMSREGQTIVLAIKHFSDVALGFTGSLSIDFEVATGPLEGALVTTDEYGRFPEDGAEDACIESCDFVLTFPVLIGFVFVGEAATVDSRVFCVFSVVSAEVVGFISSDSVFPDTTGSKCFFFEVASCTETFFSIFVVLVSSNFVLPPP